METENTAAELKLLKGCINDLISLLALPAIWKDEEPSHIVVTLLDVLVGMFRLEFAYVRLMDTITGSPFEAVRTQGGSSDARPHEVGQALKRCVTQDVADSRLLVPSPIGGGEVSIAPLRFGIENEMGILIAGSRRPDFPTKIEKLLLQVAANQTAIKLQETRALQEQKRATEKRQERLEEGLRQAQKMEIIGTLAGGLAHDFNNILAIIMGHASELKSDGLRPDEHVESVEAILAASQRGAAVVEQLLTFARRTPITRRDVKVDDLLHEFVRMIQPVFPIAIGLSLEMEPALPAIPANANQIQQALLNLCINARDAMPGGGKLTIRAGTETLRSIGDESSHAKPGDYIRITVADTGIGMDESVRSRAFDPFFTTKEKQGGTGLGLAVVYGIVRNHGGRIEIDSVKGKGTEFRLYFPVSVRESAVAMEV